MTEQIHSHGRSVPVERLRPGDHSCMDFTDVEARWEVLTAYTQSGLARGERVMVVLDPSDLNDDDAVAQLDGGEGQARDALGSGQLVLARNDDVYLPDGSFDRDRQYNTYAGAGEQAQKDGFPALRLGADMTWAARARVADERMVDYESFIEPLFEPLLGDPRFTAICWYDRQRFSDHLVAAMRRVHPLQVLERLDALDVTQGKDGVRIAGSAEMSTRGEFTAALRDVLTPAPDGGPVRLGLDLTDLCYMEAHCAWQLVDFARRLPEGSRLVVRCGPMLELVLHGLDAAGVPQLEISVEGTDD